MVLGNSAASRVFLQLIEKGLRLFGSFGTREAPPREVFLGTGDASAHFRVKEPRLATLPA
jgi:hypothetical protein